MSHTLLAGLLLLPLSAAAEINWKKHIIQKPILSMINSAVAHDWDGDGYMDILSSLQGEVFLYQGPDWKRHSVHTFGEGQSRNKMRPACIHSCLMDVDGDGDPDFIGSNNTVFWLECPDDPFSGEPWKFRLVDDVILGTHCLITGDEAEGSEVDMIHKAEVPRLGWE